MRGGGNNWPNVGQSIWIVTEVKENLKQRLQRYWTIIRNGKRSGYRLDECKVSVLNKV